MTSRHKRKPIFGSSKPQMHFTREEVIWMALMVTIECLALSAGLLRGVRFGLLTFLEAFLLYGGCFYLRMWWEHHNVQIEEKEGRMYLYRKRTVPRTYTNPPKD
jgi:hypothetical protein